MILVYFVLGIILAFVIARYNESNKLFWILLTSFMLGITGGTIWYKCTNKEVKKNLTMTPTQTSLPSFTRFCVLANEETETPDPIRTESVSLENSNSKKLLTSSSNINYSFLRDKRIAVKPSTELWISNILTQVDLISNFSSSLVNLNNL